MRIVRQKTGMQIVFRTIRLLIFQLMIFFFLFSINSAIANDNKKTSKLTGVLQKPEVTVVVVSEVGRRVYLGGEVQRPGTILLQPNQTLTQALFEAGGLKETAHKGGILILRHLLNEGTYVLETNLDNILAGQDADVLLEPYDIIYVSETIIAKVDRFVEQYINRIIPRAISFPFLTELATQPVRVVDQGQQVPAIAITR